MCEIKRAKFPEDIDHVISIYREYVASASVSLDFQNNDAEFENLAENYDSPGAGIYLAWKQGQVVGCAAFRKVDSENCEMKRVYVKPEARGRGIGVKLIEKALIEAKISAYSKIYLDVLPEFEVAIKVYERLGFAEDEAITFNPVPGTRFLSLVLG